MVPRCRRKVLALALLVAAAELGLGIYHRGRKEFTVGVDPQSSTARLLETGESIGGSGGRLALRYDF